MTNPTHEAVERVKVVLEIAEGRIVYNLADNRSPGAPDRSFDCDDLRTIIAALDTDERELKLLRDIEALVVQRYEIGGRLLAAIGFYRDGMADEAVKSFQLIAKELRATP